MPRQMNDWQTIANEHYGDNYEIEAYATEDAIVIPGHGDTLALFIASELSESEDCESIDVAISRMDRAIADLEGVRDALLMAKEAANDGGD